MNFFRNTELAKLYLVSEKTVRNWISAAQEGRIKLQLHTENGRSHIANTASNNEIIESLIAKGRKYKNSRSLKVVKPRKIFYELYSSKQIFDIISNLDIHREIPLQYTYFHYGAERWEAYTQRLIKDNVPNSLSSTIELLELNITYIDYLVAGRQVNIIDLGVGTALPVKGLLEHFIQQGKLKRYIGIDISQEMLGIAQRNLCKWFGDAVKSESHVRDITYERFDDLLAPDSFGSNAQTVNLVLFLGGTLSNFRNPHQALITIRNSMGKNDLLFFTKKIDTQRDRQFFELAAPGNQALDLGLDFLNIDPSLYTIEASFDEEKMLRAVRAKPKIAIIIEFELNGQTRAIELNKGEEILLWRARHQTAKEIILQFDKSGFDMMFAAAAKDNSYLFAAFKLQTRDKLASQAT